MILMIGLISLVQHMCENNVSFKYRSSRTFPMCAGLQFHLYTSTGNRYLPCPPPSPLFFLTSDPTGRAWCFELDNLSTNTRGDGGMERRTSEVEGITERG